jgi:hypothetical protein
MKKRICITKMPTRLAEFLLKARVVQDKLSTPEFNSVLPTPAEVVPLLDQIGVFLNQSLDRDYTTVWERRILERQVNDMLRQQVSYVNAIANGNEGVLSRSGFEMSKEPAARVIPGMGEVDNVINLFDGDVIITCKRLATAERYQLEVHGPDNLVVGVESFGIRFKIPNLPSGVDLMARVRGINRRGDGEWSPSMIFRVAGRTDR